MSTPSSSQDALLAEVLVAPRRAFFPLPDTQVIERPGWLQIVTPSLRQGGLNEVVFSDLSDTEADSVIDATIAKYENLGLRFRWSVFPNSRPHDLAERLARRGLVRSEVLGMAYGLSPELASAPMPEGIEEVDAESVDEFTEAMARGWEMDPTPLFDFNRAICAEPSKRFRMFLARLDGRVVGTASSAVFERSAYLMGAVVLPEARRQGIYRALVAARMRDAAKRGLSWATSHANAKTSGPILEKLGFELVCRFCSFSNAPVAVESNG